MRRFLDRLYLASAVIACASVAAIAGIIAIQVTLNIIDWAGGFLGLPDLRLIVPSYGMLSGYGLAFATFMALGPAIRHGAHIRVTSVHGLLPATAQRMLLFLVGCAGVLIGALMAWSLAELTHQSWRFGDMSSGLVRVPLWAPQSVMAVGAAVFAIACLDTAVEILRFGRSETFVKSSSDRSSADGAGL